jgi:hypothetical protein
MALSSIAAKGSEKEERILINGQPGKDGKRLASKSEIT